MVDHIKRSTTSWIPYEVNENPFRDQPMEKLKMKLNGLKGVQHKSEILQHVKKLGLLGHKSSAH